MKRCIPIAVAAALSLLLAACGGRSQPEDTPPPTATSPSMAAARAAETRPPLPPEKPLAVAGSIYFASAETAIDESGKAQLRQHAARLKEDPRLVVTLIGFTDNQGSRSYNLALADARLDAVSDALRSLGVARKQIRRQSGHGAPVEDCTSAACRQQMRRVDLVYGK